MRRAIAYILLTAGLTLLFLSPLLIFYVGPRVEKAPLDTDVTTTAFGTGSYFSERLLEPVDNAQLENVFQAKGDPRSSTHDVAVVDTFSQTIDRRRGAVESSYSIVAFDRSTGYAVDCCGAKPRAKGLTLKFPFGTKKTAYPFWDGTALQAFPARYVRTESVEGLRTYVFVTGVPATLTATQTVPGFLLLPTRPGNVQASRFYQASTTLWVEPGTGAIVKASQRSKQWLEDPGGKQILSLANVSFALSPASVRANVRRISAAARRLDLLRTGLPVAGPVLGIALLVIGLRQLRSADRAALASASSSTARAAVDEPLSGDQEGGESILAGSEAHAEAAAAEP